MEQFVAPTIVESEPDASKIPSARSGEAYKAKPRELRVSRGFNRSQVLSVGQIDFAAPPSTRIIVPVT